MFVAIVFALDYQSCQVEEYNAVNIRLQLAAFSAPCMITPLQALAVWLILLHTAPEFCKSIFICDLSISKPMMSRTAQLESSLSLKNHTEPQTRSKIGTSSRWGEVEIYRIHQL